MANTMPVTFPAPYLRRYAPPNALYIPKIRSPSFWTIRCNLSSWSHCDKILPIDNLNSPFTLAERIRLDANANVENWRALAVRVN
ncbi:hypothetical protein PISMIDRAFT_670934 [Pisolithus microcarpus 441]|uniref:Unplaced genomic scaffold scaffold_2, whole genome shotgun sequence n=1 Tax=Pisolithus microcarpus 441 TaxID=765257 RepID=A0A0D0AF90_9AGAM|nr:hypothetical protein PISMIDRAFT_670934 [Pisolithus microcarpus 441]